MTVLVTIDGFLKRLVARRYTYKLSGWDPTGLVESILFSWPLDLLHRYKSIRKAIFSTSPDEGLSILDVGGGRGKIAESISPRKNKLVVMDLRENAIKSLNEDVSGVIGDMSHLPFRSESVDCVVSADAVEHLPSQYRVACFNEMRRVATGSVVIHCPVHQQDADFLAGELDPRFNSMHRRLFGCGEPNIQEHIDCGWPTLDQFRVALPDAQIQGTQNGQVWKYCLLFGRIPFLSFLVGPIFWALFQRRLRRPPFFTALVQYNKNPR